MNKTEAAKAKTAKPKIVIDLEKRYVNPDWDSIPNGEPDPSKVSPEISRYEESFLWLQIPTIHLRNNPKKWEFRLEFDDSTVKIRGTEAGIYINTDENCNSAIRAIHQFLRSGDRVHQPEEAA